MTLAKYSETVRHNDPLNLTAEDKALVTQQALEEWLQQGIIAAKSGDYEQARFRLLDVVEQDQANETAWFWLYQVFDRYDDKRICLENLLIINPENQWARQELLKYLQPDENLGQINQASAALAASPQSATGKSIDELSTSSDLTIIRLVAAFWLGISIILLGGGIIATSEWLVSGLRTRTIPDALTIVQLFELFIAILFVITGVIGINVAIGLFLRSMAGFYGSILLALGLLLVGPTLSLIITPPNYLVTVCTGGIAGMIVLLTLASQPGFK